jgi:hypothetical protein
MNTQVIKISVSICILSIAIYFATLSYNQLHPIASCECGEYQVNLEMDSATIWDGDRYVGTLHADSTQAFDRLMIKDNE